MNLADVDQEILCSRADFTGRTPAQPVLASHGRHWLGTERKSCSLRWARDVTRHIFSNEMADCVPSPRVRRRAICGSGLAQPCVRVARQRAVEPATSIEHQDAVRRIGGGHRIMDLEPLQDASLPRHARARLVVHAHRPDDA
jgi:hypothetical protein